MYIWYLAKVGQSAVYHMVRMLGCIGSHIFFLQAAIYNMKDGVNI